MKFFLLVFFWTLLSACDADGAAPLSCYDDPSYFELCELDMYDETNSLVKEFNMTRTANLWDNNTLTGRNLKDTSQFFMNIRLKDEWNWSEVRIWWSNSSYNVTDDPFCLSTILYLTDNISEEQLVLNLTR